jgi:murein tripeptide amidase MpaA
MGDDETTTTERELIQYGRTVSGRDDMVRRARAAGVSKHRIHILTGIARTTIDRILKEES